MKGDVAAKRDKEATQGPGCAMRRRSRGGGIVMWRGSQWRQCRHQSARPGVRKLEFLNELAQVERFECAHCGFPSARFAEALYPGVLVGRNNGSQAGRTDGFGDLVGVQPGSGRVYCCRAGWPLHSFCMADDNAASVLASRCLLKPVAIAMATCGLENSSRPATCPRT